MHHIPIMIDGENISPTLAEPILAHVPPQDVPIIPYVYGRQATIALWQKALKSDMQARIHTGGKQAADTLLLQDAQALHSQRRVDNLYLVSNDGGFAPGISLLRLQGCEVIGMGNHHASKRLKKACTRFVLLPTTVESCPLQSSQGVGMADILKREPNSCVTEKGTTMTWTPTGTEAEINQPSPFDLVRTLTPSRDTQHEALSTLYGASLPNYLSTMLGMLLEHIFRDLCLDERENLPSAPPSHLPQEYRNLLASLEHDPVLSLILRQPHPAQQWQQVLAFAERCEFASQKGYQAAQIPFATLPIDQRRDLFVQRMQADAQRWRIYPGDVGSRRMGYSEETERQVMRRWYQTGYTRSLTEQETVQRAVWNMEDAVRVPNEEVLPDAMKGVTSPDTGVR